MSIFGQVTGVFHWKIFVSVFLCFIAGEWHRSVNIRLYKVWRMKIISIVKGGDHLIPRGGGPGKFCRDFFFSMSSTGKFIFRYTKARIYIFTRNIILTVSFLPWPETLRCCWYKVRIDDKFWNLYWDVKYIVIYVYLYCWLYVEVFRVG